MLYEPRRPDFADVDCGLTRGAVALAPAAALGAGAPDADAALGFCLEKSGTLVRVFFGILHSAKKMTLRTIVGAEIRRVLYHVGR